MKPRLKPFVHLFNKGNNIYQFYDWGRHKSIDVETTLDLKLIIPYFTGIQSFAKIHKETNVDIDTLKNLAEDLYDIGLLINQNEINKIMNEKSSKIIESFLPFLNKELTISSILNKLRGSKVAILGLGGVGSWVYEMLVRQEIGEIHIIDPDQVEISNVHRQTLYTEGDVGEYKVDIALREGRKINTKSKISTYKRMIHTTTDIQILDLPKDIDLFICCGDYPSVSAISAVVSNYCFENSITHIVNSGYNGSLANLPQTVIPQKKNSACLKCYVNDNIKEFGEFITVGPGGASFGPLAATVGELIALEAIKVLTGYTEPSFYNRRGEFDSLEVEFVFDNIEKDPDCILCKKYSSAERKV